MSHVPHAGNQFDEQWPISVFQHAFFRAYAEHNLLPAAEGDGLGTHARAGELEATPTERDLCWRENGYFAIRKNGLDAGNGLVESFERCGFIGGMHESSSDIAAVAAVELGHGIVSFIKFEETPFGCCGIEICHALPYQRGRTRWNKKDKPLDEEFSRRPAACIEPQDTEGQCGVNRALGFRGIYSQDGEGALALPQQSPRIDWSKRFFQIDAGGQPRNGEGGKVPLDGPL